MTFEQLLKEEEEIIFEKRISNLNKKRKRNQERENDAADERVELSPEMKRKLRAHKHPDWQDDGGVKFKPGRERTVAAVRNLCAKKGKTISTKQARDYIYEKFVEWDNREKSAKWIMDLENYAKKNLGYDPRKYAHAKKGDTVGLGGPGDPEYKGRAYFFTALINGFANHFLNQKPKYKPWKENLKKHKKDVKNRKAQERAQR